MKQSDGYFENVKREIYEVALAKNGNNREETCQYRGSGDRHCNMTTNKRCKRCKFYSPSTIAVFKAVYSEAEDARKAHKENVETRNRMRKMTNNMQKILRRAEDMVENASECYDKLHMSEIALWQDSVNQYE